MKNIEHGLICFVALAFFASANVIAEDIQQRSSEKVPTVTVRIGPESFELPAQPFAGYYAPYALLAAQAYYSANDPFESTNPNPRSLPELRNKYLYETRQIIAPIAWFRASHPVFLQTGWNPLEERQRIEGKIRFVEGSGIVPCPEKTGCKQGIPIGGLSWQVWQRNNCSQVVVAFRGTELKGIDGVLDVIANMRSLFRWAPIVDQYDQAGRLMHVLAEKYPHCFRNNPNVIVVGHSLGGGLAQYAAYSSDSVSTVYAFDSSFVTGFSDFSEPQFRAQMRKKMSNLTIHRVHEHGDILQFPRWIAEAIFTPQPCNPTVRTVRFNTLASYNPITSHSMEALAFGMFKSAHDRQITQQQLNDAVSKQRQKNERVVQVNCDKLQF